MDKILKRCLNLARQTGCEKMGFGTVMIDKTTGEIEGLYCNEPIATSEFVCINGCVRKQIKSRTQSMIGSCFHSEEFAMQDALRRGLNPHNLVLYVAGVFSDGTQAIRENPKFSCIRCASQMVLHGFYGVYLWNGSEWIFQLSNEAYKTSYEYAVEKEDIDKHYR